MSFPGFPSPPSPGPPPSPSTHSLLSATHDDTTPATAVSGDFIRADVSGSWERVGVGSEGQVITVVGGLPAWSDSAGGNTSTVASGTTTTLVVTNTTRFIGALSGVTTIALPATPVLGQEHVLKDVDGQAGTTPITIDGSGNTIDGAATKQLVNNYESMSLIFGPRFEWNII